MGLILFLGAIFIGVGLLVTKRNAAHVFTKYARLPYKERSAIDATKEAVEFRRFHFFLGGSLLLFGLAIHYVIDSTAAMLFAVFYPLAGYLFFMARGLRKASGKESRAFTFGIVIMAGSILLVLLLMRWGFAPNGIHVDGQGIEISGPYGEKIRTEDLAEAGLANHLPEIKMKQNGFAVGRINKGFFRTKDGETIKLLLDGPGPYLFLRRASGDHLYYCAPGIKVDSLVSEIQRKIPGVSR